MLGGFPLFGGWAPRASSASASSVSSANRRSSKTGGGSSSAPASSGASSSRATVTPKHVSASTAHACHQPGGSSRPAALALERRVGVSGNTHTKRVARVAPRAQGLHGLHVRVALRRAQRGRGLGRRHGEQASHQRGGEL